MQVDADGARFIGKETDIVILVIGPIGAGKSTFVNKTRGDGRLPVSHGLSACTTEPCPTVISVNPASYPKLKGHRLVLVDTPGFDNPNESDRRILTKIDAWLGQTYPSKLVFGGLLYIHDITNKTFKRADKVILNKLSRRYGSPAIKRTILATTNWGPPPPNGAESREEELKAHHWSEMTADGAKVYRFMADKESAWTIINDLLGRVDPSQNESGTHLMYKVRSFLERWGSRK